MPSAGIFYTAGGINLCLRRRTSGLPRWCDEIYFSLRESVLRRPHFFGVRQRNGGKKAKSGKPQMGFPNDLSSYGAFAPRLKEGIDNIGIQTGSRFVELPFLRTTATCFDGAAPPGFQRAAALWSHCGKIVKETHAKGVSLTRLSFPTFFARRQRKWVAEGRSLWAPPKKWGRRRPFPGTGIQIRRPIGAKKKSRKNVHWLLSPRCESNPPEAVPRKGGTDCHTSLRTGSQ